MVLIQGNMESFHSSFLEFFDDDDNVLYVIETGAVPCEDTKK